MKLIPIKKIIRKTNFSKEELYNKLFTNIEKKNLKKTLFRTYSSLYRGKIIKDKFEIKENYNQRDFFNPYRIIINQIIKGEIKAINDGSVINITITPNIFGILYILVWLGIGGYLIKYLLFLGVSKGICFYAFGVILGGYVMLIINFNCECNKLIEDFDDFLEK